MEQKSNRLIEDLADSLDGEIRSDRTTLAMYSTDASLYQIRPLAVAYPRSQEDVVTLARYSAETETPLIPRGAGTGVAGGAIGDGIVVDFARYMNAILEIGGETVRVQPGVVRDRLNLALREHGRYFAPDPSNSAVTTLGSMLAIDAAGSHAIRVGSTRDHVQAIELVLAGGETFEAGVESTEFPRSTPELAGRLPAADESGLHTGELFDPKRRIVGRLAKLLADNEDLIRERQPPLPRNCSGYHLRGLLAGDRLNLARLLVGSEGTLALFTAATLHTVPLQSHRGVALLLFGELDAAIAAVQAIAPQQPSACDLLDRRLLSLGRDANTRFAQLIPNTAEAAVIIEQTGYSDQQVRARIAEATRLVRAQAPGMKVACEAYSPEEVELIWSLPSRVVQLLTRLTGESRPLPFIEDIAVPPATLSDFLQQVQRVFQKHEVTASLYAHAASGQLHLRPFLPYPRPEDGPAFEALARDVYQVVFAVGGTISGEHGDGLARTAFIRSQYGPLYRVFQEIKEIFDPHHLLNPGKIISDDPHLTLKAFRAKPPQGSALTDLQLTWTAAQVTETVLRCNGCGVCRTQEDDTRMCPFFRVAPDEHAAPRARANLVRDLLIQGDPEAIASPEVKKISDLCFNCRQCEHECPAGVDVPGLMTEARAAWVTAHGLDRAGWTLSRAPGFARIAASVPFLANRMISGRWSRWCMEKVFGIARQRKLPRFHPRPFLSRRHVRKPEPPAGPTTSVLYFVDYFANYHDPELAEAFLRILAHNDIPVQVPRGQTVSGMALVSVGDLQAARQVARENLAELVEPAREGARIVCTEPSAAVCLRDEYPRLLDTEDARIVASQVVEAGAFLSELHQAGQLDTSFEAIDVELAYHTPCHVRNLGAGTPLRDLLSLIPGIRVTTIERGCSGMAGVFGLATRNFATSMQMAEPLLAALDEGPFAGGTTECSSCRMQMEQGTHKPTIHPLKLIACAYGLMPELLEQLRGLVSSTQSDAAGTMAAAAGDSNEA